MESGGGSATMRGGAASERGGRRRRRLAAEMSHPPGILTLRLPKPGAAGGMGRGPSRKCQEGEEERWRTI